MEKTELLRLKEAMSKYVREIEQHNDNLERGKRYVCMYLYMCVCVVFVRVCVCVSRCVYHLKL